MSNTMKNATRTWITGAVSAAMVACSAVAANATALTQLDQAVNFFENGQATGGNPMTVDAKGPVEITDAVELPGFAFAVYDVDITADSLTMTLTADLEKLQVTLYDNTTYDRYYFAFDTEITSAQLSDATDENFNASVEVLAPGETATSMGAFMGTLPTDFTFEKGGILITIGEGTDLTKITENGGSLTVNF